MTAFDRAWRILKMGQHSSYYQIDQSPHAGYNTPLHEIEQAFPDIHESPHYYDNRQSNPRNFEQSGFYGATEDMFGETLRIMNESRNNPSNKVRIYRAIPDDGSIPDEDHEINEGDWVALSESYAHEHGNDYLDGDYVVLDKLVDAQHLYSNGDSIYEFGYDTAEKDIEKASWDEQAYNNFKRLMGKHGELTGFDEGGFRMLDEGGAVDLSDGMRYRFDDELEEDIPMGEVPVEIGRGIEHQVYSIPQTERREGAYVAKVPLPRFDRPDRVNRNEVYDGPEGVTRSPIEAYWSKVLGRSQPVLPYSLFNSKGSLDLVQRDMREYNPYIEPMTLQMAHLLGLEDVPSDAEDFLGEYDEVLEDTGEPPKLDTFGGLIGYGDDAGDDDPYAGNVSEEGLIFDYGSKTPFVDDTRGGMVPKEQIDRILQDAIHEQKNVPKRYSGYQSDLDQTIRQLISELEESSKKGRFTGSSISFPEIRRDMDL